MALLGKQFVMRHVFKNVPSMEDNVYHGGETEDHFNIPWKLCIIRKNGSLDCYLNCVKSRKTGKWLIETQIELKLISQNGKQFIRNCVRLLGNMNGNTNKSSCRCGINWEILENNFLVEGELTVEARVRIKKMTGIYKDNLRSFDETMKDFSDITLSVEHKKFYVSKLFIASHSSYFQSLFLGNFEESKKSEISLSGIDSDDFQKFLEVLYGYSAIDDNTVEGILLLADMYDTKNVIEKCEEFLTEKSEKTLKKKLEMSTRYNLEKLKNKCLSEIKTVKDVKSILPANINEMDSSLAKVLLEKFASFS